MSPKSLLIAAAVLTVSAAAAVPALSDTTTPPATPPAAGAPMMPPVHALPFRAQILFNLVDTNGDGSIDATEFAAFEKAAFNALDTDHDGKLSVTEFERIAGILDGNGASGRAGPPLARFQQFQRHWGPGRPGFGGPGNPMRQGMLDGDQQPSVDQGGAPQNFASLDKNGDGVISPDEFSAGAANLLAGQPPAPPAPPAASPDQQQP